LSKRHGDASYEDFIEKGYLKEAIVNYITLLGWAPGDEREKFTIDELIAAFDIKGISKSPAIFDEKKLAWLNGEYIRELSPEKFHEMALPFYNGVITNPAINLKDVSELLQPRCEKLSDIPEQVDFFDKLPEYDNELYTHKKMKTNPENSLEALNAALPVLEAIDDWTKENIHDELIALVERLELKNGRILWPVRVAVSGKAFTPGGGVELAYILGKDETIARIKKGIEQLSA
jgi:glutamyl-tRNA synthetase